MKCRDRVVECIELLARPAEQLNYEKNVPIADIPAELVCMFADDLFHPKMAEFVDAFSEEELKLLAELYGLVVVAARTFSNLNCHRVSDALKIPEWRSVISCAKRIEEELNRTWK